MKKVTAEQVVFNHLTSFGSQIIAVRIGVDGLIYRFQYTNYEPMSVEKTMTRAWYELEHMPEQNKTRFLVDIDPAMVRR